MTPPAWKARAAVATALVLVALSSIGIRLVAPPSAVGETAPATDFSSARAMRHVRAIAQRPHPMGSPAHAQVRDYLIAEMRALGLEPTVQATTAVAPRFAAAGSVQNIVGRLRGSATTQASRGKALMLSAHYDGVAAAPGAGDDAAGVAAVLEAVRAIRSGPPLRNDLIVLITDGEEDGLLGAQAFSDEHAWMREVGAVLNFEGRGASGASLMFETSERNGAVVRRFARAAPRPVANSLMYSLYTILPNDTDMSVFKRSGAELDGLNFGFIGAVSHYHTPLDTPDGLDERSLQHHGSTALALARDLGGVSLPLARRGNAVYFNLPFTGLVVYDQSWALPLAIVAGVIVLALLIVALSRGALGTPALVIGLVAPVASCVLAIGGAQGAWWLVRRLHASLDSGRPSLSGVYALALIALVAAAALAVHVALRRRTGALGLMFGALAWWLALAVLSARLLPGASYLFVWPLLSAAAAVALVLRRSDALPATERGMIVEWLTAAVPLLLWAPTVYLLVASLGLDRTSVGVIAAVCALVLVLLAAQLELITAASGWRAPAAAATVALIAFGWGAATVRDDARRPRPNELVYALDADADTASWASPQEHADAWTRRFLGDSPSRAPLPALQVRYGSTPFIQAGAPVVALPAPTATVLTDAVSGSGRTVELLLSSPRGARIMFVDAGETPITGVEVNGRSMTLEGRRSRDGSVRPWSLRYYNVPPSGIRLRLAVDTGAVAMRITDASHGIPPVISGGRARPPSLMPHDGFDLTVVTRLVRF